VILCDYSCAACDVVFESTVESPAPDVIECPVCKGEATWYPTPVHGHVKRVEVVRGKWNKPERPTYYDTRELGEGMEIHEWRAKRRAIRDEERKKEVMEISTKRTFGGT
jgi:hypothetical protein